MYLAEADKEIGAVAQDKAAAKPRPSDRWQDFPYSILSHHGRACCEVAREWVLAMDFAQLNGADRLSGPRWLRQKYEWGPSPWPMHWCEAVTRKTIDCGAHAALAHAAFGARGLTAYPTQLVQVYSEDATEQWRGKWARDDVSCHWLDGAHIYHEATALLVGDDEVKIWDASAGSWIPPRQAGGYGSLAAIRIFAPESSGGGDGLRWGERRLKPNLWNQI
ncbi:MAG: hypothetical protein JOZ90_05020 [Alphaproteobacteria bacterium]|nr:hypothetical protein [Alphaproteobacteria bacterium]MBV9371912.1 hypothetical protein [Alphaproteobacteria bacterium]MBV9900443.1 hypothetical protein [Alphaproteobacteria bacterium]